MRTRSAARSLILQAFSLFVAGLALVSIFCTYTGLVGDAAVVPTLLTVASAVVARYAAVYHRFSRRVFRVVVAGPAAVVAVGSSGYTVDLLVGAVSPADVRGLLAGSTLRLGRAEFLPDWWILAILGTAGVLVLGGALVPRRPSPYPKPASIRAIARSPAYLGVVCTFFGLWAVLFVGIAIQRVVVIAPIFEELLKFGVAVLVGSVLFDRSLVARIGVALVVGMLFGLVEHATTYPGETDLVYLNRTLFHALTTVLSVAMYTTFESMEEHRLQWIAPAYPMLFHFFFNTFAVLSGILGIWLFGAQQTVLPLLYGLAFLIVALVLLVLVFTWRRAIVAIHRPLEHVLSTAV
jgi:hypothetical protein